MKAKTPAPAPPAKATPTDSRGNVRVYIDLPSDLVRRFNVMAASRDQPRRALLAEIVRDALAAAKF